MNLTSSELQRLIRHRRSIPPEQFDTERKIEDHIIQEMLINANWAPTHGLTEPWRFVVFASKGLKELGTFQAELYKKLTPENEFKQAKYDKLAQRPLLASHVISIGMKRQEIKKIPEVEEIEAVACAVQNMLLTAAAFNVSAFWTSGGITYEQDAKSFFGLDSSDKLLGFLYVGYPKGEWPSGHRKPVTEKIKWVK